MPSCWVPGSQCSKGGTFRERPSAPTWKSSKIGLKSLGRDLSWHQNSLFAQPCFQECHTVVLCVLLPLKISDWLEKDERCLVEMFDSVPACHLALLVITLQNISCFFKICAFRKKSTHNNIFRFNQQVTMGAVGAVVIIIHCNIFSFNRQRYNARWLLRASTTLNHILKLNSVQLWELWLFSAKIAPFLMVHIWSGSTPAESAWARSSKYVNSICRRV